MELVARVEERLRAQPDDGKGWDVIAPVYLRLQRYGDAAFAFSEANRLLGVSVKRLLGFAEARLLQENGVAGEDVRRASEKILELEPQRHEARIWLTLAKEQDGDLAGAVKDYKAILSEASADEPWRSAIAERVDRLEKRIAGVPEAPSGDATKAPDAKEDEQAQMIAAMVDRLAQRLKTDGRDLEGWLKLMRAYKVLGRDADAVAALGEARRNFAGDAASLSEIDTFAKGLGLGS
jgi:cytochrome c-type biogenesis protein CcmH